MNSYNENLHSSIVSSLSDQKLEMQKAKAEMDASKFSLYYAQGATITSAEKLDKASTEYLHQQKAHKEAVIDSDFSTNVLASANSSKSFVDKAVSNTAVAAANVQIATNAIVKLASDIGSVYNIVNAGDYASEIYDQSDYANKIMSKTAYLAEKASEKSMNTSSSVSKVATTSLASKATNTDASIKSLLEVVSANFTAKGEEVATDNQALANANTAEKLSEGVLEENNVNYCAILDAYNMSNEDLNLDLKVLVTDPVENLGDFVVTFDRHKSAFPKPQNKGGDSEPGEIDFAYPVDNYFLMFVKYDRSNIFSIANAEGIIQGKETNSEGKYRYVKIDPSFMPIMPENRFTEYLNFNNLVDTDGVPLEEGDNYVVFLLATLTNDYKKLINTYDDYLSAPSKSFSITTYLQAVDSKNIVVLGNTKDDSEIELVKLLDVNFEGTLLNQDIKGSLEVNDNEKITIKSGKLVFQNELTANLDVTINDKGSFDVEKSVTIGNDTEENLDSYEQVIVFAMPANADGETTKEYRCMFLPNNPETIKNLLTADDLKKIQKITEDKDRVVFEWTRKINEILAQIEECEAKISTTTLQLNDLNVQINDADKKPTKTIINKEKAAVEALSGFVEKLAELNDKLIQFKDGETAALQDLEKESKIPEFYFDLTIAQKVPYGSYTQVLDKIEFLGVDFWYFQIETSTTDNFGNRLNLGEDYIPVILTIATDDTYSVNKQFTNALSNITNEGIFTYALPSSKEEVTMP